MSDDNDDDDSLGVTTEQHREAHDALDHWLAEAAREANEAQGAGRAGYLGRLKLCAFVVDDALSFRLEWSFSEDL